MVRPIVDPTRPSQVGNSSPPPGGAVPSRRSKYSRRASLALWGGLACAVVFAILWGLADAYRRPKALENLAEEARLRIEAKGLPPLSIQLDTDFEGAQHFPVTKVAPTHFVIDVEAGARGNFFMFRLKGMGPAGATVRVDLKRGRGLQNWATLHPVYSYVRSLEDPAGFQTDPASGASDLPSSPSRGTIPDARRQKWQFIPNAAVKDGVFTFTHAFERDSAFVSMKYPLTPGLNAVMTQALSGSHSTQVHEIASTDRGRPLTVVQVGDGAPTKPCAVLYAREHGNEQDAGWVAWGALRYLRSNAPRARHIRERATFLVVPLFDPDGAAEGIYSDVYLSFAPGKDSTESLAFRRFFEEWKRAGGRVDVTLNLHNTESAESGHLFCPQMESEQQRLAAALRLHNEVLKSFAAPYRVERGARSRGDSIGRLGHVLAKEFGAAHVPYEANSQAPGRHLTLEETQRIGQLLVDAAAAYLIGGTGPVAARPG
jgi:hypothetical protein